MYNPAEEQKVKQEKKEDEDNHTIQQEIDSSYHKVSDLKAKREQLKKLLSFLSPSSSFREDVLWYLKKHLMLSFAKQNGFKKLLLGITGHKVASALFS